MKARLSKLLEEAKKEDPCCDSCAEADGHCEDCECEECKAARNESVEHSANVLSESAAAIVGLLDEVGYEIEVLVADLPHEEFLEAVAAMVEDEESELSPEVRAAIATILESGIPETDNSVRARMGLVLSEIQDGYAGLTQGVRMKRVNRAKMKARSNFKAAQAKATAAGKAVKMSNGGFAQPKVDGSKKGGK